MSLLDPLTRLVRFQTIWNPGVFLLVAGLCSRVCLRAGWRSDTLTLRLNESRCLAPSDHDFGEWWPTDAG
jgi:hypothetical protein